MRKRKIVLTGLGVIAPNAIGKDHFWLSLKNGRSGLKPIKRFDTSEFDCKIGGEVEDFDSTLFLGNKKLKNLDRTSRLLCSAAKMALDDARLTIGAKNTDIIGVCTGTTLASLWNFASFNRDLIKEGPMFTDASLFPGTVMHAASSQVSIRFGIHGFNTTIATGYSSSIDALKYAIDFIRLGRVKAVLVGAVESLTPANFTGFYRLGFFAGIRGEELSCPFDRRRNGIILSEGSAVAIVEDEEYALNRNANIYAEVKDIGNCFDAFKMGKYNPEVFGLQQSIKNAIRNSGFEMTDIDYINASANSVPEQDRLETKAIKQVFGKHAYNMPVSSIKSMIGETFSAGGLFQIASSVGSMQYGFIPPTINYRERDEECDLDYVANTSRLGRINNILVNNFGPGGNNASLVLSKYQ